MFDTYILSYNWVMLLVLSFTATAVFNAIIACSWKGYFKNSPVGRLSHSQLRVRQGNANIDHRINVFFSALMLSFFNLRIYLISIVLWIVLNLLNHFNIIRF